MEQERVVIYLVRHGETLFNTTGQVQGWCDSFLTAKGEQQAEALGKELSETIFQLAFSGDLGRQRATANIILLQNKNQTPKTIELKGLREWYYGGYEGKSNIEMWQPVFELNGLEFSGEIEQYIKIRQLIGEQEIADQFCKNDPLGLAESYEQIKERTLEAMDRIIDLAKRNGGGNILVVSSGNEIQTILRLLVPSDYHGEDITNCSVSKIVYENGRFSLEGGIG